MLKKEDVLGYFNGNFLPFFEKYLPKPKRIGGNEYRALCPFHEDKDPSLSINGKSGQYFCHGCGKKGDAFHFYAKLHGLTTKADFSKVLSGIASDFGIRNGDPKSKLVATYDYHDAAGNLLFQVCRMEPKRFAQRRPDGNGWTWNLKGVEPVLYRLPEVLAATEVCITEGEKDADALVRMGFTATTTPMGAGKWRERYADALVGKDVLLFPDNDNPGREHMVKIAQSLHGKAGSLKLIELPGLPSGGDVYDFLSGFDDHEAATERLAVIIENAPPYEPPKNVSIEDIVLNVSDFQQIEIAQRGRLLAPFLKLESINQVYGWRGVGKTFFALGMMDAVSRGEAFGPWQCEVPTGCLFVDGEMTVSDNHERFADLGMLNGNRQKPLLVYSDHYANRLGLPRANMLTESWREKIQAICKARDVGLLFLDNIASLTPGIDENAKKDWDPINQWLLGLRYAGISTVLLHHESKEGRQRGTSAREDNLDTSIRIKAPPSYVPEDGCRFVVHFSKARVKTADLKIIGDTEFKLTIDAAGAHVWAHNSVKASNKSEVLKLINDGFNQQSIAEALAISKGRVSQIIKEAKDEGLIAKNGHLTPSGCDLIWS